ncbi:out at first protein-like [Ornithodoros turicata]|uniref:Putative conserved secreted protein n=1 Tax=Ornithodoros turicata TaxID=34597 RepID=A0A2R5LG09_9ACAR
MVRLNLLILLCQVAFQISLCQLVINVRNQGGDVLHENLIANTSDETILLEFRKPEGTHVTQFIDFKMEVQVFRVLVLGEEEQSQNLYQVMCFVTRFNKVNFISVDAMSKLRQRNPTAIRQPEEDRGRELLSMDLGVDLTKSSIISPHLPAFCQEAADATYAREVDLRGWATTKASSKDLVDLTAAVHHLPSDPSLVHCNASSNWWQPCQCHLEVCVGWYPCGLKYCRGKDATSGRPTSFRCGIKSCRKCRDFEYYVREKRQCLWD